MNWSKWVLFLGSVSLTIGCASVDPGFFQSTLANNPNINPESLQTSFKEAPVIDKQSGTFRYQVYKVGFFNNLNAIYFKNGQMVTKAPYNAASNLNALLQIGAGPDDLKVLLPAAPPVEDRQIGSIRYQVYKGGFFNSSPQALYFKDGQLVTQAPYDDYANLKILLQLGAIGQEEYDKKSYCVGSSCTCLVTVDCNGVCGGSAVRDCAGTCGGSATTDACGVCNGSVSSCFPPLSCLGDSCTCVGPTDCNGTCGGTATTDCAGTCGGSATTDICGVCGGNGSSCAPPST